MANNQPRVSIGMPVYNGEDFIEQAIDSILAQTYPDFELIISDNASTDRTCEICEQYAARDQRIRYYRVEKNQGAAWNFNRVFSLASGEFFKWAAHDDIILPEFLEKAVAALDQHPEVVLAASHVLIINDDGERVDDYTIRLRVDSPSPRVRFRDLVLEWHLCYDVFGLMRTDIVRQTPVMGNYGHGDGVFLERMAVFGPFYEIPGVLFHARIHPRQSMRIYGVFNEKKENDYHQYTLWFDPLKAGKIILPNWRILAERLKTVWGARLGPIDRLYCYFYLFYWAGRRRAPLAHDLWIAAWQIGMRLVRPHALHRSAPVVRQ